MAFVFPSLADPAVVIFTIAGALFSCLLLYSIRINLMFLETPARFRMLAGSRWDRKLLSQTYKELAKNPINYTDQLPPRLNRRYIVTGGAGLVGGHIVLQLLARGTPPESIRVIDIRRPERNDLHSEAATRVDFIQTDITSLGSVQAAFCKPWNQAVAHLPLTVFHTAAIIVPSARSKLQYEFVESVNVRGTKNVLIEARKAGADIFSSTSSASIAIRPVELFPSPWVSIPKNFAQVLDESDFYEPLRPHEEFFGNYPASKALAERLVCEANDGDSFRTGCIRPGNGVYGDPTDNTVGGPLSKSIMPTISFAPSKFSFLTYLLRLRWVPHIVQSFVHGANVAVAHLHHEAVLTTKNCPQAGRPFVVTDPNPPITYRDLYNVIKFLSLHSFHVVVLPPILILLLSHIIEWYILLPYRYMLLKHILPEIRGDLKYLQPGLFSICTHLVVSDSEARKPVEEGGLGYRGVLTTLQGMVWEVLEWNREHGSEHDKTHARKAYTTSVELAEQIQKLGVGGVRIST
ncbi:unnamed protein product [Clonostachys byssicola]|uniref:3-beta hydroxysteroid dehydrogenase/isomerase domain-containing protein n=1 Tax=Clonostachys byssicola TaxID=160290 RepID=A0A9N9UXM7_9HYPO|nr:unnamed protein product [Clonostachys byssicola]